MKIGRSTLFLLTAVVVVLGIVGCDNVLGNILSRIDALGPDINIKYDATNYASGGATIEVGPAVPNQTVSFTINIENVGNEVLKLTENPPLSLVNTTGSAFSVTAQPEATVNPGADTSCTLQFLPVSEGLHEAEITVTSNDADEPDYTVEIEGLCVPPGTVTSPASGTAYKPDTQCSIEWGVFVALGQVTIELLKDGTLHSTIAGTTDDDGSFAWDIPAGQIHGDDYTIKVSSIDYTGVFGESDTFAIGTISGVDPNGAEKFKPGENPTITWSSEIGGSVDIELWKAGAFYSPIASDESNTGSYGGWTVPALNDDDFRIRVISVANPNIYDQSDSDFAIGTIGSIAPTGGAFIPGSTATITWSSGIGGTVKMELLKDGLVQGSAIALSTENDGSYAGWTVPPTGSGTGYKIRITSNQNTAIFNESAVSFSIGTITVTAPNGGQAYDQGNSATITWTSDLGGTVRIQLLKDGTPYGPDIVSSKNNTSGFTHSWTIPSAQKPSVHYRIRISSNLNAAIYDDSNADFKIRGWDPYGEYAGSSAAIYEIDFAMGSDSNPVVAYMDSGENAIARRWNGSGWVSYGGGKANDYTLYNYAGVDRALAIGLNSSSGVYLAYVSHTDEEGGKLHLKYASTGAGSWTDYGYGSPGAASSLSMAVDIVNAPFIAHTDWADGPDYRARATRYYSSAWEDKGHAGVSIGQQCSIALSNYWYPFVGYVSTGTTPWSIQVKRWSSGTTWTDYGTVSGATGGLFPAVANKVDLSSPYIVFVEGNDLDNGGTIRIKKHSSGTTWTDCGSLGTGKWNDIVLDPVDGKPYVVFQDFGASGKATVKKYSSGTTWTSLGSYEYTSGYGAFDVHIAVDPEDDMPVIAFYDAGGYVRVVKRVY